MITATCQHSGLTFEAKSKAAKNHPAIADLLTEANKKGAYQAVKDLLVELKAEGVSDLPVCDSASAGKGLEPSVSGL